MSNTGRKGIVTVALATMLAFALTACGWFKTDDSEMRTLQPGDVAYIMGTDPDGQKGDKALIERKPNGMWVAPVYANFRDKATGDFNVKVTLDKETGTFVVLEIPKDVKVGNDHDDCLDPKTETYVVLSPDVKKFVANQANWEPNVKKADNSNDDCIPLSQQTEK